MFVWVNTHASISSVRECCGRQQSYLYHFDRACMVDLIADGCPSFMNCKGTSWCVVRCLRVVSVKCHADNKYPRDILGGEE